MPKKLREPQGPFETFDWFMAEFIAGLPDTMSISLLSLPHNKLRQKMKNRVIELAASKGIKIEAPADN